MPDIFLGYTTDDPRKLTKNITWDSAEVGTPCKPTDPCDVLNPTLILAYNSSTGIFTKNYAKIPDWGDRQYFIKDIQVLTGGKVLLSLAIDVLTTYDTSIRACKCCITRAELAGPTQVPDSKLPIRVGDKYLEVCTFTGGFTPNYNDNNVIVSVY